MKQNRYYIVFTEVCGIYRPVKRFSKKAWLQKYLNTHPNVSMYRVVGQKFSFDFDIAKQKVVHQIQL